MNGKWEAPGGRLRLLRSPDNLHDVIAEVPPDEGTLLVFENKPNAWHGFEAFDGERVGQAVDALISTLPLAGGSKSTARSVGLFGEGTAVKIALFRRDCPLPEKYLAPLDIFRPSREREG